MKTNLVGLIYTGEYNDDLGQLTKVRSVAALPMLGRYRLIDFLLSGMVNSGIRNIGIIMQQNYHSLMDHLGSGREWDLHGKRSGMTILPPYLSRENKGQYSGLLNALRSNLSFLRRSRERYIVVSDSRMLYSLPFEEMAAQHIKTGADMTLLYSKNRGMRRNGVGRYLDIDPDGVVRRMECDPIIPHYENTYMSVFIVRRELLIDLVDRAVAAGNTHFTRELLMQMLSDHFYKVMGYECPGQTWCIDSVQAYFDANMALLDDQTRKNFFNNQRPIWTKLRDEMPTRYRGEGKAVNSFVADGCVIEGTVEDSILFRAVHVHPGAKIRHALVMQDAIVYRGAELENVILDKEAMVRDGTRLIGPAEYPIVVAKGMTV